MTSNEPDFKPFDRVLVRDSDTPWRATLYSHKSGECHCCIGGWWDYCVPFEGNEHLLGKADWMESEQESISVPNAPNALRWTKERPKDADYNIWLWREYPGQMPQQFTVFWAAMVVDGKPEKVLVAQADIESDVVRRVANMSGEWAGPILEPAEADGAEAQ